MATLRSPYLFMALSMLCWAGNWLLGRAMHEELTPIGINFWRWSVALLVLLPIGLGPVRASLPLLRAHWRLVAGLTLLGVTIYQPMIYMALEYTTAINAALVNSTGPVFIVAMSWLVNRDTISARQGLGILVSLLGVLIIVTHGDPAVLFSLRFNPGDLWALGSMPVWGLYTVLLKHRPPGLHALGLLTTQAALGLVMMAPAYALDVATGGRMVLSWATVGTIVYMGVFASVVAYVFWNSAVPRVGPNKAGLFLHLHPAFTTVLAIVFLGERPALYHGAGIVLILLGITLTTAARAGAPAAERSPA